ncbi:MAG TPA: c-type cytochrome, partial [Anaeromyxobacteraceae bacterium]|nr:c-type cytochrome [Anaeromyxobacteraceae bacterium]
MIRTSVVTRAVLAFAVGAVASSDGATPPDPAAAERGRSVFNRYCISCHGVDGDGRGPTADWIDPRPRILTSGTFKFRSTPSGKLPTDADLYRTITNGLHHTFMPRWAPTAEMER